MNYLSEMSCFTDSDIANPDQIFTRGRIKVSCAT